MIVKDEHDNCELAFDDDIVEGTTPKPNVSYEHNPCHETYIQRTAVIRDPKTHASLQVDLMKEIWKRSECR